MIYKPRPKKSVQNTESVAQPIDSTYNKDKAIAEQSGDNWHIAVYTHPVVKSRFSYQLTINRRVRINPSPIEDQHPNLFGCFGTPQEAIEAGLEEIEA